MPWNTELVRLMFSLVVFFGIGRIQCTEEGEEPVTSCQDGHCFILECEKLYMDRAEDYCVDHHQGHLVTVKSLREHETLMSFIDGVEDVKEFWIGAEREPVPEWQMFSSAKGGRRQRSPSDEPRCGCAVPDDENHDLDYQDENCSDKKSHLCVKSAQGQNCADDFLSCGLYCISFVEEEATWYQARQDCINQGGGLYSPLQTDLNLTGCILTEFVDQDERLARKIARSEFWINMSSVKWVWTTGGDVKQTFWYDDSPRDNEECMKYKMRADSEGGWEDASCSHKFKFVCETTEEGTTSNGMETTTTWPEMTSDSDNLPPDEESTTPFSESTDDGDNHVLYIALGAVGILAIIVIILSCALLLYIKRHKKSTTNKKLMDNSSAASSQNQYDVITGLPISQSDVIPGKPYEKIESVDADAHPYTHIDTYEQIPADYEAVGSNNPRYVDTPTEVKGRVTSGENEWTRNGLTGPMVQDPEYADITRQSEDEENDNNINNNRANETYLKPESSVKHHYEDVTGPGDANTADAGNATPSSNPEEADTLEPLTENKYMDLIDPNHNGLTHTSSTSDSVISGGATVREIANEYLHPEVCKKNSYLELTDVKTPTGSELGVPGGDASQKPVKERIADYIEVIST